jgi:hypothetical protein
VRLTETEYWNAAAAEERAAKRAAEAVNDLLTPAEAMALEIAVKAFPNESAGLVESIFDERGWPDDDASELWLSETGQTVWAVYRAYCTLNTKAAAA